MFQQLVLRALAQILRSMVKNGYSPARDLNEIADELDSEVRHLKWMREQGLDT